MMDQPDFRELIEAVRGFVDGVAVKELSGHSAFHARVAANVLAILSRELEQGPGAAVQEHMRLERLLEMQGSLEALNRELCRRLRAGMIDETTPGLAAHLIATTIAKVRIDQPGYSGLQTALAQFTRET